MPSTKAVEISLNNPNLKNLEIIDTPGVNDPIVSREECTKALLKDCHVVFIISPSNQFLTDSDMSLFDRVSNKEGLQEIYFVASQADSTVGSMSEVEKSRQHLPTALENAQKSLSSQLKGYADDNNYRLQLDYSLKNLIELKRFKEAMNESYQSDLNDEKLQNDLREWRDQKHTGRNKPPRV
ncbi:hypothetical protein BD0143_14670 [Helicobacter pylori]